MAGSCHSQPLKNSSFLPEKWANTSVVTILQQLHNAKVEFLNPYEEPLMQLEQRANYILDGHLSTSQPTFQTSRIRVERRAKPRASDSFPARVWGVDSDDQPFSYDCHLENISASGLYLRMPRRLKFASVVSLVVELLNGPVDGTAAAIKGTVIRDESKADGHRGFGIRILEHKFI